jgi:WD40 repeat protein
LEDLTDPFHPRQFGQPLTGHTDEVESVAFAPGGRTLATASKDKTVILWDLRDPARPQRIGEPLNHNSTVFSVAFSADGRTLATGTNDNAVILWDLTGLLFVRDHALQLACAHTGGALDPDQWNQFVEGMPYEDSCAGG